MSDTQPSALSESQLEQLARRFPDGFVEAVDGQSYVAHHIVNQRLLQVVGPFDFELVRELRSDLPEVRPDPAGRSARARRGSPALHNAITGGVWRLTVTIDGRRVRVEEVGDVDARNKDNDGARLKDTASDALKRCAMRLGLGLHLWAQEHYFLDTQLKADRLARGPALPAVTPQEAPGAPQEPDGDQDPGDDVQGGQEAGGKAGGQALEDEVGRRVVAFFGGDEAQPDPAEVETVAADIRDHLRTHPDELNATATDPVLAALDGDGEVLDPPGWEPQASPGGPADSGPEGGPAWEGDTGEVLTLQQIADATGNHFMHILNMVRKEVGHWATLSPGAAAHLDPDQLIEANDAVRRHLLAKRAQVTA